MVTNQTFLDACTRYATRQKKITQVAVAILASLNLLFGILSPMTEKEDRYLLLFTFGACAVLFYLGYHVEKKAIKTTLFQQEEYGRYFNRLAQDYDSSYKIFARSHQVAISDSDLMLFNKNGLSTIPLNRISNVSRLIFRISDEWDFMHNIKAHISSSTKQKISSFLEDIYGKNADLTMYY